MVARSSDNARLHYGGFRPAFHNVRFERAHTSLPKLLTIHKICSHMRPTMPRTRRFLLFFLHLFSTDRLAYVRLDSPPSQSPNQPSTEEQKQQTPASSKDKQVKQVIDRLGHESVGAVSRLGGVLGVALGLSLVGVPVFQEHQDDDDNRCILSLSSFWSFCSRQD